MPDPVTIIRDIMGIAGAASMAYGAWLVFPPAGFITGGVVLFALAVVSAFCSRPPARPSAKPKADQ